MIGYAKENLEDVKNVLVDGGYSGEKFSSEIKNMIDATVEVHIQQDQVKRTLGQDRSHILRILFGHHIRSFRL